MRKFVELPQWSFDIDEVFTGVYKVVAKNNMGRQIVKTGIDPEALITECKREAAGDSDD